jgi:hypothetical protein
MYKDVQLFINGEWTASASGRTIDVVNPATEEVIGKIAHADRKTWIARWTPPKGFRDLAQHVRLRALQDHAPRRRPAA